MEEVIRLCERCGKNKANGHNRLCRTCQRHEKVERDAGKLAERVASDDGEVTSERMKKVWGQQPGLDSGPTEERLREWLAKDAKGYSQEQLAREKREGEWASLEAEVVRLRVELAKKDERIAELEAKSATVAHLGPDAGSERAKALIQKLLREHGV